MKDKNIVTAKEAYQRTNITDSLSDFESEYSSEYLDLYLFISDSDDVFPFCEIVEA